MKDQVRVAAIQMKVAWLDVEANLANMTRLVTEAARNEGVELVVFPELASSGYVTPKNKAFMIRYVMTAQKIPGAYTAGLGEVARKHGVYLVAGMLEAHPLVAGTLYNSAVLIAPDGKLVGVYRKCHIPSEEKHYFYAGTEVGIYQTELGVVGVMVCADNAFPEMGRLYALKGAEIVAIPYSRERKVNADLYKSIVTCRAYENQYYVVAANRVGQEGDLVFEGRSCIAGPLGDVLASSQSEEEEIVTATIDSETLIASRAWQARFRDRRPDLYGPLSQAF